jgi:phosphinothricin acetyltransferase
LTSAGIVIRHAESSRDGAACAAIYAPFVTGSAVSFEETPPDAAEFADRIAKTSKRFPWLVAELDGAVAGFAYASEHRQRAAYRWAADVAVYVGEGRRRGGVGKRLYTTLFELLARQGLRKVCAGVTLPNEASLALHESCGFRLVGVYRRIGFKAGAWHDVAWWQLELQGGDPPREPGPPASLDEQG